MLKLDFCPTNKSFSQIFKIYAYLYDLSFIWQNFEKNHIHNHLPSTIYRPPPSTIHHRPSQQEGYRLEPRRGGGIPYLEKNKEKVFRRFSKFPPHSPSHNPSSNP